MTIKNRLEKLEGAMQNKQKFMCVIIHDDEPQPEEGFTIQPLIKSAGGNGGKPFTVPTFDDVQAFAARPDVDLKIYEFNMIGAPAITGVKPDLHNQ